MINVIKDLVTRSDGSPIEEYIDDRMLKSLTEISRARTRKILLELSRNRPRVTVEEAIMAAYFQGVHDIGGSI